MHKKILILLSVLYGIVFIAGCNDSPTDLGKKFIEQDDLSVVKLSSDTDSITQSMSDFNKIIELGNASHILLGKSENVISHIMMKFVFGISDTAVVSQIKSGALTVLQSWIELNKEYSFGDSNATFDYTVHKILDSWTSATFTADSFPSLGFNAQDISTNRKTDNDTLYTFDIDNSLVFSWLQNFADTNLAVNNGILLSPTENTNKVLGFTAFNLSYENDPRVKTKVQLSDGTIDTLYGYVSADLSIVLGYKPDFGNENIIIQSGLVLEAKLAFDLSLLPKDIDVNYAKLTFTVDTVLTKTGSSYTNSLRVFMLSDSTSDSLNTSYYGTLSRIDDKFVGDITGIVRAWKSGIANQGLLVRVVNELYGLERFVIKGSNAADLTKRPKLEIVYSRKKI